MSFGFDSLHLGEALRLTLRTVPMLLVRLGVYLAFWIVAVVYLAISAGIAFLVGKRVPWLGVPVFMVALVSAAPLYDLFRRYVLYIVKAAHLAVISEMLVNGDLPSGVSQFQWGKDQVRERFGQASAMFVMDKLVSAVVRVFAHTAEGVASFLPGRPFRKWARVGERIARFSLTYVDEAILGRAFWTESKSIWSNVRDGVILYCMVWKSLLANAVALTLISYLPFVVTFLLFVAPMQAIAGIIASRWAALSIVATALLAFLIKAAVGDAFAMAAMVAAYERETEGLAPDPKIAAKLDHLSSPFRRLTTKAQQEGGALRRERQPEAEPASGMAAR